MEKSRVPELRRDRAARQARVAQALGHELGESCAPRRAGARDRRRRAGRCPPPRPRPARDPGRGRAGRFPALGHAAACPTEPGEERARARRLRARPARRSSSMPARRSRSSARGPTPGSSRTASGARKPSLVPGRYDRDPAGFRRSDAILQTTFEVATPERAGEARRRPHRDLDRRGDGPRPREVPRDRGEVEVALVDAGALDARNDLRDRVPHDARVLAVERVPRAEEDRARDSVGAPRRSSSRSGSRTCAPRSSPSTRPLGCAGRRRRRAASRAAPGSRAPRPRRRTRRGRGARGSARSKARDMSRCLTPCLTPGSSQRDTSARRRTGLDGSIVSP